MAPGQGFHLRGLQHAARAFGQICEVQFWHSVRKCPSSKGTGGAVRDPPDCATARRRTFRWGEGNSLSMMYFADAEHSEPIGK